MFKCSMRFVGRITREVQRHVVFNENLWDEEMHEKNVTKRQTNPTTVRVSPVETNVLANSEYILYTTRFERRKK